jgi:uncharacterized protein (TIGR02271 family)
MQHDRDEDVLPLIQEDVSVTKQKRLTGRVRVSTQTETVDTMQPVELAEVEVEVIRVPVGRKIDAVPDIVTNDDLTIIPVIEERVVLTRELYLREEVHIRRITHRETSEIPVTIKRQTAHVERLGPEETGQDATSPISKEAKDDL